MKFTFLGFFLIIIQTVAAQHAAYNQFDSLLHSYYANNQFNGSAIIIKNGERVLLDAYGFTTAEKNDAISIESLFLGPALNELFVGLELTKLTYEKKLDLNETVQFYIPELQDSIFNTLKVWHLAYSCSGLPNNKSLYKKLLKSTTELTEHNQIIEFLSSLKSIQLSFEPGSKVEQNPLNSILLGAIIEKIKGHKIGTYFWANYFGPLGMRQAYVYKSNVFNAQKPTLKAFNEKGKSVKASKNGELDLFQQIFISPADADLLAQSIIRNGIIQQNLNFLFLKPIAIGEETAQKQSLGGLQVLKDYEEYEVQKTLAGFTFYLHYNQTKSDFVLLFSNAYTKHFDEVKRAVLKELNN